MKVEPGMRTVRHIIIAFVAAFVFTLPLGCSHADSLSKTQHAIRKAAVNKDSQAFADDFALFFGKLTEDRLETRNEKQMDEIAQHAVCMMIGAIRYPEMKARIDAAVVRTPVKGLTMRYGDFAVLPFSNLWSCIVRDLAGLGMSPSVMRLPCGDREVRVGDKELKEAMNEVMKSAPEPMRNMQQWK